MATGNHFEYWAFLTLFSAVALASLMEYLGYKYDENDMNHKDWEREERWVVSVAAISLIMSAVGGCLHVSMKEFVGSSNELGLAVVILALWCAGLPTLMDEEHQLAMADQDQYRLVGNVNLFFSSWGALIVCLMVLVRHFELYAKRSDDRHLYKWAGLAVAGLVVLSDTARYFKTEECGSLDDNATCRRTLFGLVLGAVSFVFGGSSALVRLDGGLSKLSSGFFLIAWCFGIAYLTYGDGPAVYVSPMYFAIWAAFCFSLSMAAPAFFELLVGQKETTDVSASQEQAAAEGDAVAAASKTKTGEEVEEEEVAAETA
jgi:hypothetical protein